MYDFLRVSSAVPTVSVANPMVNAGRIISLLEKIENDKTDIAVFPELCITGYTCGDLFFQKSLTDSALEALGLITEKSKDLPFVIIVGLPVVIDDALYNCAAVISEGIVKGIIPKTFIPNYAEFNEKRWFVSANNLNINEISSDVLKLKDKYTIPVGADIIFDMGEFKFGAEICEDLWSPIPPSSRLALGGAHIVFNLSASNETVAKHEHCRNLISMHSASCNMAYVFTSAGYGESTTDTVFFGHSVFAENGAVISESDPKTQSDYILTKDIDIGKIKADRKKNTTFHDCADFEIESEQIRKVKIPRLTINADGSFISVDKAPFIPKDDDSITRRCNEVFQIQVAGLKKRLEVIGKAKPVIGVSGGLDSTLALLVSVTAAKEIGLDSSDVHGITLPCFGTSDRTYNNALLLMKKLGITVKEINIKDACIGHFKDIDHDINIHDLTYENSQARERTQVIMDYSGKFGGIVIGTGDLSELALGWCTYNGDHMSMYGVNAGIPKTLIRLMVKTLAKSDIFKDCREILLDIADTPISPELIPPDENGVISQETESLVGPYELHDFFIYNVLRYGFEPEKVYKLALMAFRDEYDSETILRWLKNFYKRFFTQQFKRSCIPDGVKIGSIGLSPRGDWRMPSDALAKAWLDRLDTLL